MMGRIRPLVRQGYVERQEVCFLQYRLERGERARPLLGRAGWIVL